MLTQPSKRPSLLSSLLFRVDKRSEHPDVINALHRFNIHQGMVRFSGSRNGGAPTGSLSSCSAGPCTLKLPSSVLGERMQ